MTEVAPNHTGVESTKRPETAPTSSSPVSHQREAPASVGGGLLTISEQDLADFKDEEFNEIWSVLGKVIRARSKRNKPEEEQVNNEEVEDK